MAETLFEFSEGPYDVLNYTVTSEDGKMLIEVNDGDLGRLPVEDLNTVEKLREALDKIEAQMIYLERRQEEL